MKKSTGRRSTLRANQIAIAVAAAFAPWGAYGQTPPAANTLPNLNVTHGQAVIQGPQGNYLQIDQQSHRAVYQGSMSIGSDAHLHTQMPASSSAGLFKDVSGSLTQIYGRLTSNGQVFISNQNGVLFGSTARVEVGSLFASSLSTTDAEFMAGGRLTWSNNGGAGPVTNHGTIITPGGYAALAGPNVANHGMIIANAGTVALAAGDRVSLDMIGDGLISITVEQAALNAAASNTGVIEAQGGRVLLTARSANALLDTVVNAGGAIRATSLVNVNGEIVLDGGNAGTVMVTGRHDARSTSVSGAAITMNGTIATGFGSGTQTVTTPGALTIQAGSGFSENAGLVHLGSGEQKVSAGHLSMMGGNGGSSNHALITSNNAAADQTITVAGGMQVNGGAGIDSNQASVRSAGNQHIQVGGTLGVEGGAFGSNNTAFVIGADANSPGKKQVINAGSIIMRSGAGGFQNGAVVVAPRQEITTSGDVIIAAGGTGGQLGGVRIGGTSTGAGGINTTTDLKLKVGNDLLMTGGLASGNAAIIGSTGNFAQTTQIEVGRDVALGGQGGSIARIGTGQQGALGDISVTAGRDVRVNGSGEIITAGKLTLKATSGAVSVEAGSLSSSTARIVSGAGQDIEAQSIRVTSQNARTAQIVNGPAGGQLIKAGSIDMQTLGLATSIAEIRNNSVADQKITVTGDHLAVRGLGGGTATIFGNGNQTIDMTRVGPKSIILGDHAAQGLSTITSNGDQKITGYADITLIGGSSTVANGGNAAIIANNPTRTQRIEANNLSLANSILGGNNSFAGIQGANQTIHALGNVTLTANASGGTLPGVRIGGLSGTGATSTNLLLSAGGDVVLTAGSANNGVGIGTTAAPPTGVTLANNITIDADGSVILNAGTAEGAGVRIGASVNGNTPGDIRINAGGTIALNGAGQSAAIRSQGNVTLEAASITAGTNGAVFADTLTTTTSGATNLAGANDIAKFTGISGGPLNLVDAGNLQVTGIQTTNDTITLTTDSLTSSGVITNGGPSSTANIVLNADSFNLAGGQVQGGNAAVILRPRTGTNSFGIQAAGQTMLTNADIASIHTSDFVVFGSGMGTTFKGNMAIGQTARVEGGGKHLAFFRSSAPGGTTTIGGSGVNTTGNVIVSAGGGAIVTEGGIVSGDQVQLRASQGIGSATARVQTSANRLALNNTGPQGAFVSQIAGVTLGDVNLTVGGIANNVSNTVGGNGAYDVIAGGSINVSDLLQAGSVMLTTNTGSITQTGAGAIVANSLATNAAQSTLLIGENRVSALGAISGNNIAFSNTGDLTLSATAFSGDIDLSNAGSLTVSSLFARSADVNNQGAMTVAGSWSTFANTAIATTGAGADLTVLGQLTSSGSMVLDIAGTLRVAAHGVQNVFVQSSAGQDISASAVEVSARDGRFAQILNFAGDQTITATAGGVDVQASGAGSNASIQSNGVHQTVNAEGGVRMLSQVGGGAQIGNAGSGDQSINVSGGGLSMVAEGGNAAIANISLSGGSQSISVAGGSGIDMRSTFGGGTSLGQVAAGRSQTIQVTDADHVSLNGISGSATITANGGTQTLSISGSGANAITLGSAGAIGTSQIVGGSQNVTAGAGAQSGSITLIGSNANGRFAGLSTQPGVGGTQSVSTSGVLHVTGGAAPGQNLNAGLFHAGSGAQTVNAARIELHGGAAGNGNGALIVSNGANVPANAGAQNINVTGDLIITGGAGGSAGINGPATRLQQVRAHNIEIANSALGGNNSVGFIQAGHQDIRATGNVTLTARASGGGVGGPGVRVGGLGGNSSTGFPGTATDLDLYVGGNLVLNGGTAVNNGVGIGSTAAGAGLPNEIYIRAGGSVILNSGTLEGTAARIGSSQTTGTASGNIEIHAGGAIELNGVAQPTAIRTLGNVTLEAASIRQGLNGFIVADTLTTTTTDATTLAGPNEITRFNATSGGALTLVDAGGLQVTGISTTNDTITLTTGSLTNTGVISNGGGTANIVLNADAFNLVGGTVEAGSAAVILRPRTGSNSFGIESAGQTTLTNADIASIHTSDFVVFGSGMGTTFTGNMIIGENARVEGGGKHLAFFRSSAPFGSTTIGAQGVSSTGNVIVSAGGGAIVSNGGTVAGDQVQLRASQGIGAPFQQVWTAANRLALNNTGGQGAFVAEADDVTLGDVNLTVGGIANNVANVIGGGNYDVLAGGSITISDRLQAGGVSLGTGTGSITEVGAGAIVASTLNTNSALDTILVGANQVSVMTAFSGNRVALTNTGALQVSSLQAASAEFSNQGPMTVTGFWNTLGPTTVATTGAGADLNVNGFMSSNGPMALEVDGTLRVAASGLQDASLQAFGTQSIRARGVEVTSRDGRSASINSNGPGGQRLDVSGGSVDVEVVGGNGFASIFNGGPGSQSISVVDGERIRVDGISGFASIGSISAQEISITGNGANAIRIGSGGALGGSNISGQSQIVTAGAFGEAGSISIVGSDAGGRPASLTTQNVAGGTQTVSTNGLLSVTGGSAPSQNFATGIFHGGSGDQAVNAARIELNGGAAGNNNAALIVANNGAQNVNVTGDLIIAGAAGGNAGITGPAARLQSIRAANIHMTNSAAGGFNSVGFILGGHQDIRATGDLTMTARASGGDLPGVRIGGLSGAAATATDLMLNVGGDLVLTGGTLSGNGVGIGSTAAPGPSFANTITINTGGDVILNSGVAGSAVRIGSSATTGPAAGDIRITAGGDIRLNGVNENAAIRTLGNMSLQAASITEGPKGLIEAGTLQTKTSGDTLLGGPNRVGSFTAESDHGNVHLTNTSAVLTLGAMDLPGTLSIVQTGDVAMGNASATEATVIAVAGDVSMSASGRIVVRGSDTTASASAAVLAGGALGFDAADVSLVAGNAAMTPTVVRGANGVEMRVGNELNVTGGGGFLSPALLSSGGDINLTIGSAVRVDGGSGFLSIARVQTETTDGVIRLTFPNLTEGGYFVNGIEGRRHNDDSGFYSVLKPAKVGKTLLLEYAD